MNLLNPKALALSLFICINLMVSSGALANSCEPNSSGSFTTVDQRSPLNLPNSPESNSLVKFFPSDPVVSTGTGTGLNRRDTTLLEVRFRICSLNNVEIDSFSVSLAASNKHLLTVVPDMFNNESGSYKLISSLRYRVRTCQDGCRRQEIFYKAQHSVGIVNLHSSTPPSIALSSTNLSANYGSPVDVTVTVSDSASKLVGILSLNMPSTWSVNRRSCAINSSSQQKCTYRLNHTKILSNIKNHNFTVTATDRYGQKATKTGRVSVIEPNYVPKISTTTNEATIGVGGKVTLAASAEDDNNSPTKGINSIRWCYAQHIRGSCKPIVSNSSSTNDNCKIASSQSASCEYSYRFNQADEYWVWAEVSDSIAVAKTRRIKIIVDAPPTVALSALGNFTLNETVTLTGTSNDADLQSIQLCYGPNGDNSKTCVNQLESCTSSPCTHQLFLDAGTFNAERYSFYTLARDGFNDPVRHSITKNILGSFTVSVPQINASNNLPGTSVNVSGTYLKLGGAANLIGRVELWVNEVKKQEVAGAGSPFSFNFTLGKVRNHSFKFKLIANNGTVVYSASKIFEVDIAKPSIAPAVGYTGVGTNTSGKVKLQLSTVPNATQYQWYEYASCPQSSQLGKNISTTSFNDVELTINKTYSDNGSYCYCARAVNSNGAGPVGLGNACAQVTLGIADDAPGQTLFESGMALTQTENYLLRWKNSNPGAREFKLEKKSGQVGSSDTWLEIYRGNNTQYPISGIAPGDVSYRVAACNNDNVCLYGQNITVNHQAPYLHNVSYVAANGSTPAELLIEGIGLQGIDKANLQIRNSAETMTRAVYQASGDGSTRYRIAADSTLIAGLKNGGLRLHVITHLGEASIEFNDSTSSDREYIDLVGASPTVSADGVIYISSGKLIHALKNGNNLNQWPFALPNAANEAEIKASPTLDKDNNNNDVVFFGATNRFVYKLDYQANILWQTRVRGEIHAKAQLLSEPNAYHGNKVEKALYIGTVENGGNDVGGLYSLNATTGAENFMYPLLEDIKQPPHVFSNGDLHVTTEDDQLHIINRNDLGPFALRWQDIDSSLIQSNLAGLPDWQIPEDSNVPIRSIAGLFYGLLGRAPSHSELTFFAYANWSGTGTNEITSAFLDSSKGQVRFPLSQSDTQFVDTLFSYLFPSELDKDIAGGLTRVQWVNELTNGVPRSEVAYKLVQTDDYYAYSANSISLSTKLFFDYCDCDENADSDNDGVIDSLEISLGFNPLDPNDLLFDDLLLSASEPVLGDFSLNWQALVAPSDSLSVSYRISEEINNQPDTVLTSSPSENQYHLTKASGNYQYKVQACYHEQICSQWSNTVSVLVGDSVVEAALQPEAAPSSIAASNFPSATEVRDSALYNVTAGQFRVDESGAATYRLPFTLPSGIAGVQPELGLAYSSQAGESTAGVGWSLQGVSAISRCGSTKLLDGYNKPVVFDATDHFCMAGQRLLLTSGVQGGAGSTYINELDNQQVITYLSGDYFEVEGKDKSLMVYGASDNSKQTLLVNGVLATQTWLLSYSQDNLRQVSNQIDYSYIEQYGGQEKLLDKINYSKNRLVFLYDTTGRIKSSGYVRANRQAQRANLVGLDIYSHEDLLIRRYSFDGQDNDLGQREVTRIQECGIEAEACKKAVTFDYRSVYTQNDYDFSWRETVATESGEYLRHAMVIDTNNDGFNELVTLTQTRDTVASLCVGTPEAPESSCVAFPVSDDLQQSIRLVPTDPDGDGLTNFLINTDNDQQDGKWRQLNVSAQGTLSFATLPPLTNDLSMGINIKPMDFNGDGYNDIVETNQRDGADDATIFVRLWSHTSQAYLAPIKVKLANSTLLNPKISAGWQSADVNQDGLSDILVWDEDEENLHLFTIDPSIQTTTDPICERRIGGSTCNSSHYSANLYDTIEVEGKHATPLDFNRDGLTDMVVYDKDNEQWQYHLNIGDGFVKGIDFANNDDLSSSIAPIVVDLDSDGRLELVFHDSQDGKWYRYEWSHLESLDSEVTGGFERIPEAVSDWTFSPPTDDPLDQDFDHTKVEYGQFADIDNDGLIDFIYKRGNKDQAHRSLVLYHGGNRIQHPGLLQAVTSGTGLATHIEYDSMASPAVYRSGEGLPIGMTEQDADFRVLNIAGASALVSAVSSEVPLQDSVEVVQVEYAYQGARAQFARGNLGFESITTTTYKDFIPFKTTTTYSQVFPTMGMPLKTEQKADGFIISLAENRYYTHANELEDGYHGYQVYQQESRECQANIDSLIGRNVYVSSFNCLQTITEQDEFANVSSVKTGHYDSLDAVGFVSMEETSSGDLKDGGLKSLISENIYGETEETKRFGRLSRSTATHTRGELSETRISAFSYLSNGMLEKEILEPEGVCAVKLITTYTYDDFGNRVQTAVSNDQSCEEQISRISISEFDTQGRYVDKTTQNGIVISEVVSGSRNALGQPTKIKNTDGTITTLLFDAFGTEVGRYNPSGAQQIKLNMACDDAQSHCFTMVVTSINGIDTAKEYVDTAGQVYQQSKRDVLGNWHDKSQTYDHYGRVTSMTEPGLLAVTSQYDAFDRLVSTVDANTGLTVTQNITDRQQANIISGDIPGGEQIKTTVFNALGEQYQVIDELNNTLTYTYDVFGGLSTVHSSADGRILSNIGYDKLGRKTSMQDADRGNWAYKYDAFGQLIEQTDARGIVTVMEYDDAGRKISQNVNVDGDTSVPSQTLSWEYGAGEFKHRLLRETTGTWQRHFYYDHLGRSVARLTNLDGITNCAANVEFNTLSNDLRITNEALADPLTSHCVIQQSFFDEQGRVFQQFDDYRRNLDGTFIEARGIRQHYQYNQVIKQQEAREGTAGRIYHEIVTISNDGLLTGYNKGNQTMTLSYDAAKRLTGVSSGNFIQSDLYSYDSMNNLTSRHLAVSDKQTFTYDELNRVTQVNDQALYQYDSNGNLDEKDGWSLDYAGGNNPLHGVTERRKNGVIETYGYDANGNQIWGKKNGAAWRTFTYSGRNKATKITVDNQTTTFSYDANNKRFKRTDSEGTVFYVGNLELTLKAPSNTGSGAQETYIKRYLGDAMQTYYANGNAMLRWLYKDHLGSVIAIANDSGKLVKRFSYDVFGQQTEIIPTTLERDLHYEASLVSMLTLADISPSTRGYTGHEPVDFNGDKRIVHMNGRMYDAALGRMLQADPVVQAPSNLQNYNAFSYVLNNPLSYTDPSGFNFLKKYWRVIVAAVVTVVTYGAATGWATGWLAGTAFAGSQVAIGAIAGGIAGFAGGAVSSGSLKGALRGAFSGAVFGGLGGYFKAANVGDFAQIGSHALAGGIMSDLQGGKFGHGFFTAGVMKGFGKINFGNMNIYGRTVIQAMVGGTVSKLTGGKFANGAVTAAIQFVVNEKSGWIQKQWENIRKPFSIIASEGANYVDHVASQHQAEIQNGADRIVATCGVDTGCLDNIKTTSRLLNGVSGTTDALGGIVKAPHLKRGFKFVSSVSGNLSDALDVSSAALEQKIINLVPAAAGNGLEQMINTSPGNLKYGGAVGAAFNEATNQYLDRTGDQ